jgi:hypothetical protein
LDLASSKLHSWPSWVSHPQSYRVAPQTSLVGCLGPRILKASQLAVLGLASSTLHSWPSWISYPQSPTVGCLGSRILKASQLAVLVSHPQSYRVAPQTSSVGCLGSRILEATLLSVSDLASSRLHSLSRISHHRCYTVGCLGSRVLKATGSLLSSSVVCLGSRIFKAMQLAVLDSLDLKQRVRFIRKTHFTVSLSDILPIPELPCPHLHKMLR